MTNTERLHAIWTTFYLDAHVTDEQMKAGRVALLEIEKIIEELEFETKYLLKLIPDTD